MIELVKILQEMINEKIRNNTYARIINNISYHIHVQREINNKKQPNVN